MSGEEMQASPLPYPWWNQFQATLQIPKLQIQRNPTVLYYAHYLLFFMKKQACFLLLQMLQEEHDKQASSLHTWGTQCKQEADNCSGWGPECRYLVCICTSDLTFLKRSCSLATSLDAWHIGVCFYSLVIKIGFLGTLLWQHIECIQFPSIAWKMGRHLVSANSPIIIASICPFKKCYIVKNIITLFPNTVKWNCKN